MDNKKFKQIEDFINDVHNFMDARKRDMKISLKGLGPKRGMKVLKVYKVITVRLKFLSVLLLSGLIEWEDFIKAMGAVIYEFSATKYPTDMENQLNYFEEVMTYLNRLEEDFGIYRDNIPEEVARFCISKAKELFKTYNAEIIPVSAMMLPDIYNDVLDKDDTDEDQDEFEEYNEEYEDESEEDDAEEEDDDESSRSDKESSSEDLEAWLDEEIEKIRPGDDSLENFLKNARSKGMGVARVVPFKVDPEIDIEKQLPSASELEKIYEGMEKSRISEAANCTIFVAVPGEASDEEVSEIMSNFECPKNLKDLMIKDYKKDEDGEYFYFMGSDGIEVPIKEDQTRDEDIPNENPYMKKSPLGAIFSGYIPKDKEADQPTQSEFKFEDFEEADDDEKESEESDEVEVKACFADAFDKVIEKSPKYKKFIASMMEEIEDEARKMAKRKNGK